MTTSKLWEPSPARIATAQVTAFARRVETRHGVHLPDYESLWRWSIEKREAFWREVWDDGGVIGTRGERVLVDGARMPGAQWFPDAKLNYARNLLERRRADDSGEALVFWGEDKVRRRLSHAELHRAVARVAAALSALKSPSIRIGERVSMMPK